MSGTTDHACSCGRTWPDPTSAAACDRACDDISDAEMGV